MRQTLDCYNRNLQFLAWSAICTIRRLMAMHITMIALFRCTRQTASSRTDIERTQHAFGQMKIPWSHRNDTGIVTNYSVWVIYCLHSSILPIVNTAHLLLTLVKKSLKKVCNTPLRSFSMGCRPCNARLKWRIHDLSTKRTRTVIICDLPSTSS